MTRPSAPGRITEEFCTPESFAIDADRGVVVCRAWGVFTGSELVEHYQRLGRDPAFDPELWQIGDLRDVDHFDIENREIEITAELPIFAAGTRRALVVAQPVQFGLARMFASYAEFTGQQVRVFRDYTEAEAWIDRSQKSGVSG